MGYLNGSRYSSGTRSTGSLGTASSVQPLTFPTSSVTNAGVRESSRESGPPERVDLNNIAPNLFGFVGNLAVRAVEFPMIPVDLAIQKVTGKGFFDRQAEFFDKTIVGDASRAAERLAMAYSGAIGGAQFRQSIIDSKGLPMNAPTPNPYPNGTWLDPFFKGQWWQAIPLTRMGNLDAGSSVLPGSRGTVGALLAEAHARGYTDQDIEELQAGTKGVFDFGEYALSSDATTNLVANIAADPTTWLTLGSGSITGAAKAGARSAAGAAGMAGRLASRSAILEGAGVAGKLRNAGLYANKGIKIAESGAAIARGDLSLTTVKGLGWYMTRAARGYTKAGLRAYLGTELVSAASGAAADATEGTPVAGFFEDLHEAGMAFLDRRPISRNAFIAMTAAVATPTMPLIGEGAGKVRERLHKLAGDGTFEYFRQQLGPVAAGKLSSTHMAALFDHIDAKIVMARDSLALDTTLGNIVDDAARLRAVRKFVRQRVNEAREKGTISNAERWQTFKEWFEVQGGFSSKGVSAKLHFDPVLAAERWPRYLEAITPVQQLFEQYGVTIGDNEVITLQHISDIRARIAATAERGMVPAVEVKRILLDYPQILASSLYRDWQRYGLRDTPSVSVKELTRKLDKLEDQAYDSSLGHELTAEERTLEPDTLDETMNAEGRSYTDYRPELRDLMADAYPNVPADQLDAAAEIFNLLLDALPGDVAKGSYIARLKANANMVPSPSDLLQISKKAKASVKLKVDRIVAEVEPGIIAAADPKTARSRLTRLLNIDMKKYRPQKGKTERHTWTTQDGREVVFYTGPINAEQWREMVESTMTKEEIAAAGRWYDDFRAAIGHAFGDDSEKVLKAFAATQSGQGVAAGMRIAVQSYRDFVLGRKSENLTTTEIQRAVDMALEGAAPTYKDAPKLSDFFDSFLRKTFRSYVGNDARGLRPAAIDRHTIRDIGFIDPATRKRVFELTGGKFKNVLVWEREAGPTGRMRNTNRPVMVEKKLKDGTVKIVQKTERVPILGKGQPGVWLGLDMKDNGSFGKTTYDYGIRQMNDFTDELNAQGWMGRSDWIPSEVQAVGWYRVQLALGMSPDDLGAALDPVSRGRISFDLGISEERPLGQKIPDISGLPEPAREAITRGYSDWLIKTVFPILGVGTRLKEHFPSFWEESLPGFGAHHTLIAASDVVPTGRKVAHTVKGVTKIVDEVKIDAPAVDSAAAVIGYLPEQYAVLTRLDINDLPASQRESAIASANADSLIFTTDDIPLADVFKAVRAIDPDRIMGGSTFVKDGKNVLEVIVFRAKEVVGEDGLVNRARFITQEQVTEALAAYEGAVDTEVVPTHAKLHWQGPKGGSYSGKGYLASLRRNGRADLLGGRLGDLKRASDEEIQRLVAEHAPDELAAHRRERGLEPGGAGGDLLQRGPDDAVKGITRPNPDGTIEFGGLDAADFSTALHESWHTFELLLPEADRVALDAMGTAEQRASWFEKYMREGKAPVEELQGVFSRAKTWMVNIYRAIRGTPLEGRIAPEFRSYLDETFRRAQKARMEETAPIRSAMDRVGDALTELDRLDIEGHQWGFSPGRRNRNLDGIFAKIPALPAATLYRGVTGEEVRLLEDAADNSTIYTARGYVSASETPEGAAPFARPYDREVGWNGRDPIIEHVPGIMVRVEVPESVRIPMDRFGRDVGSAEQLLPFGSKFLVRRDGDVLVLSYLPEDAPRPEVVTGAVLDQRAADALGDLFWHTSILNGVDDATRNDLEYTQRWLDANYPGYTLQKAPKIATLINPETGMEAAGLTQYTTLGRWFYGNNIFSPATRLMRWMLKPADGSRNAEEARQSIYNELAAYGADPADVRKMFSRLSESVERVVIGDNHIRFFRDYTHLPAAMINSAAKDVLPKKVYEKVMADGGFANVLDRASNRFIRTMDEIRAEKGGVKGGLAGLAEDFYSGYQKTIPGRSLRYVKVFYHLGRFIMDPRWWAMNALEADAIGLFRYGISATKWGDQTVSPAMIAQHLGVRPTKKQIDQVAKQLNGDVDNTFLLHRPLATRISGAFDSKRLENAERAVGDILDEAMDEAVRQGMSDIAELPMIRSLVDQFGGDTSTWAEQLDAHIYDMENLGVRGAMKKAVKEVGWDDATIERMAPITARIVELNQGLLDDINRAFMGNPKRTNLERILNSYWLYWPLSYQLKAGKWMADVLTKGAFGKKTNTLGAWTLNKYIEQHKVRMTEDPTYSQMFEQYPSLWFASQMLFPIFPTDIGVSLSRPVRYVGGAIGLWPEYKQMEDPLGAAAAILEMGPFYTVRLLRRIASEVFREDETPYSYSGGGDFYTPQFTQ